MERIKHHRKERVKGTKTGCLALCPGVGHPRHSPSTNSVRFTHGAFPSKLGILLPCAQTLTILTHSAMPRNNPSQRQTSLNKLSSKGSTTGISLSGPTQVQESNRCVSKDILQTKGVIEPYFSLRCKQTVQLWKYITFPFTLSLFKARLRTLL